MKTILGLNKQALGEVLLFWLFGALASLYVCGIFYSIQYFGAYAMLLLIIPLIFGMSWFIYSESDAFKKKGAKNENKRKKSKKL